MASSAADRLAPGSARQDGRPDYVVLAVCGYLLLAVIVVFAQTFTYDFVNFDDNDYVYQNPHVAGA